LWKQATYSSIKREIKYYNHHETKQAVAEVTLQTYYQTQKKCNVQTCLMLCVCFFVLF